MGETATGNGLVKASLKDTLAAIADVIVPTIGKGVIIRRPKVVALAERFGLDLRAVRRLQRLRRTYGPGPLLLPIPLRPLAVLLSPEHVHRVLAGAPEPFAPATREKTAALSHFEPNVSLISRPPERAERRALNDEVLESGRPVHGMADTLLAAVDAEARVLMVEAGETLSWDAFLTAWYRVARQVVLGREARDDHDLTDMLAKLRAAGNWAFLHPGRPSLKRRFHERLEAHLARAEPGSLAARVAARPNTAVTAPGDQVSQWLFAFDPAGMATFRALAILATHADAERRARDEIAGDGDERPFLRACILESLRLWPTTPAILRETTQDVRWDGGVMPKNTHILIYASFFHRDDETLPEANRFAPELWLAPDEGRGRETERALVPFSAGPGICPARHLVLMLGSAMLAAILKDRRIALHQADRLRSDRALPGTLDNYTLSFSVRPAGG